MSLIKSNKILGIVTEYNPFHNGHLYHIEASKAKTNANIVIAVMSGHFTQRGEPAIADPWTRASWALRSGVDLVIEIPTIYATSSASYFAYGAISVLNALNCVDALSFGSESGDLDALLQINQIIQQQESVLKNQVKDNAHRSFSEQRSELLHARGDALLKVSKSNDILGLAYLEALYRLKSDIEPFTIKRIVSGYHDESLSDTIASATAIRKALSAGKSLDAIEHTLPKASLDSIQALQPGTFGPNTSLWQEWCLFYLRHTPLERLSQIHDMADGLPQRMKQIAFESSSYEQFEENLKTKIYTNGRLKRVMAKMLLGIEKSDLINDCGTPPEYIRILGFNDQGRQLLNQINPSLPVITNGKHFRPQSDASKRHWEIDCLAADLYALLNQHGSRKGGSNFTNPPVYIR